MEPRLGFVGIVVTDRQQAAARVNQILSEHAHLIVARTGVPYVKRGVCVITLIVDTTTDELGRLTGRLGQIAGVLVKSALAPPMQTSTEAPR